MSSAYVYRPQAEDRKISFRNEFELCYIRHTYLRKINYNPTKEDMLPYKKIVENCSRNTFFMYKNLFLLVGFELEDVISVSYVHLVNFIGLFAIKKGNERYNSFLKALDSEEELTEKQMLDKNKANLTLFLKQRMEDVIRILKQKARNIKGTPVDDFYAFHGTRKPPEKPEKLLKSHEKYGYKKLSQATFKSIKKKIRPENPNLFKINKTWYVCVPVKQKTLSLVDFYCANMNPYDNIHNMNPEEVMIEKHWKSKMETFNAKTETQKLNILRRFINRNKGDSKFSEEINTAKKLIKSLRK